MNNIEKSEFIIDLSFWEKCKDKFKSKKNIEEQAIIDLIRNSSNIIPSQEGTNGVLALTAPLQQKAIKLIDNPNVVVLSDLIFSKLGIASPMSKSYSYRSKVGIALLEKIDAQFQKPTKEIESTIKSQGLNVTLEEYPEYKVQINRKRNTHVLLMNFLPGICWSKSSKEQRQTALETISFQKDLGKMIFCDIFLGNSDRLSDNYFNGANLLIMNDNKLGLIDNEINFDLKVNLDRLKNFSLNSKELCTTIAMKSLIPQAYDNPEKLETDKMTNISYNMYEGLITAKIDLIKLLANDLLVQKALNKLTCTEQKTIDEQVSFLKKIAYE